SVHGAQQVDHTLKALEPVLKKRGSRRYLMTCFDRRRGMTIEVVHQAREDFGAEVCKTVISENGVMAESPQYKHTEFQYRCTSHGAMDYLSLFDELRSEGLITV